MRSSSVNASMHRRICCWAGPASRERVVQQEGSLQHAAVAFRSIHLSGPVARGVVDYAEQHYSLLYIVAALDDPDLAGMTGEALPACHRYLPVPLVLVGKKLLQPIAVAGAARSGTDRRKCACRDQRQKDFLEPELRSKHCDYVS